MHDTQLSVGFLHDVGVHDLLGQTRQGAEIRPIPAEKNDQKRESCASVPQPTTGQSRAALHAVEAAESRREAAPSPYAVPSRQAALLAEKKSDTVRSNARVLLSTGGTTSTRRWPVAAEPFAKKPGALIGTERRHAMGSDASKSPGPVYSFDYKLFKPCEGSTKFGSEARGGAKSYSHKADVSFPLLPPSVGQGRAASIKSGPPRPWNSLEAKRKLQTEVARRSASGVEDECEEDGETSPGEGNEGNGRVFEIATFGFGCR